MDDDGMNVVLGDIPACYKRKSDENDGKWNDMLEARVAKLESDIGYIKRELSEVRADIRELKIDIGTIKTELALIKLQCHEIKNHMVVSSELTAAINSAAHKHLFWTIAAIATALGLVKWML